MKARYALYLMSTVATLCFAATSAHAQINVGGIVQVFTASQRPVRNITITNSGDAPVYIGVQTEKVTDLSVEPATFEPTGDILVSPKNFSIGPKGQRTVRILLKEPPAEKERGYRVLFIPRASEFDSEQVQTRKSGGRSMVLKVLTGIGMLVYVEPKQVTKELDISRTSSGVTFTNRGNIQVNLTAGVVCPASATLDEKERAAVSDKEAHSDFKKKGCVPFERTRIHAGKSLTVPVPNGYRLYGKKRFGALEPHEPFTVDP